MRAFAVGVVAMFGAGCDLVLPIVEGEAGVDATADVNPGSDAAEEDVLAPPNSFICGPSLTCPLANPNQGCCVITYVDSGVAPNSYEYQCIMGSQCAAANGSDAATRNEIHCDNGAECPGGNDVCCWPSAMVPDTTYCFPASDTGCVYELCDPNAAMPCIGVKHVGWSCVDVSKVGPLGLAPRGYHVCVAPGDAG